MTENVNENPIEETTQENDVKVVANNQKEIERAELHKSIWKIANDLRWAVDWWDFKQYVLWILFYRFISENLIDYLNKEWKKDDENFDYANLTDEIAERWKQSIIEEKWFFIYPSQLFCNVLKSWEDKDLNEKLKNIFDSIENSSRWTKSEDDFKWLFEDIDVNSKKLWNTVEERNKRLFKLLESIWWLNLAYANNTIDAFWDTYEYLMQMYASNAWKSWWEFYTPQEVSELLAKIVIWDRKSVNNVYDPTCWSWWLLLKFIKLLWIDNVKWQLLWQEINLTTYNLCRINMFLHNVWYEKFDIQRWDTLLEPKHIIESEKDKFDCIVSNPPYALKWIWDENPLLINDERFAPAWVLAPKKAADLAFIMHILSRLSSDWTAAIVEFPGVLYRTWAEQKIRKYLVDNNFVDTIILLPDNLFFWTWIQTCIIVLKKNKTTNDILFIDASKEFVKAWKNNKLTEQNHERILNAIKERKNIEYFAKVASYEDVQNNDFDLSVNKYVEKEDTSEKIDIKEVNQQLKEWRVRIDKLRDEVDNIVEMIENWTY